MDRWSGEVVENIKNYLTGRHYPENFSKDEKRNFRKRAKDFVVIEGKLHYKCKRSGQTRTVIVTKEEKDRVFQV